MLRVHLFELVEYDIGGHNLLWKLKDDQHMRTFMQLTMGTGFPRAAEKADQNSLC